MARILALAAAAALATGCARTETGHPVAAAQPPPTATTTAPATSTTTTAAAPPPATTTGVIAVPTTTTTTTTAAAAPVIELGEYALTLTGTVAGHTFERPAQLSVTGTIAEHDTTNGVNALDICLVSGFPPGAPDLGAIWLGSNTGCFPSAGPVDIDLTRTTVTAATVTVEPDETVAAAGLNTFVDSGDRNACLHHAVAGSMTAAFGPDATVSGRVEITGDDACGARTAFTATFTGALL